MWRGKDKIGIGLRIWQITEIDVGKQTVTMDFTLDFQWCDKRILEHKKVLQHKGETPAACRLVYTKDEMNALVEDKYAAPWPEFRFINGVEVDKEHMCPVAYVYPPQYPEEWYPFKKKGHIDGKVIVCNHLTMIEPLALLLDLLDAGGL